MKKFINIKAVLLMICFTGVSITSCKKELDLSPEDSFNSTTFWTSESNALLALTGVYRGSILANAAEYTPTDWWSYNGLIWLEMGTDNAYPRTGENAANNKITNGTMTPSLVTLDNYWTVSYAKVARCNYFLENVSKTPTNAADLKRMIAEVRFIRACQYFYMAEYWGSVPLVTKTLTPQEANNVSKASHQDLVNFVISELTAAVVDLPRYKDIPAAEMGRACKQAALAFLGRMQLAEALYSDAAASFKSIIDFGDNIIDPNYSSIFLEANENSTENIFSVQFVPNLFANAIMQHFAPSVGRGFNLMNPLASLMESYQFTDGSTFSYTDPRFDYKNITKNRDPRLTATILYDGAAYGSVTYISNPDSVNAKDRLGNSTLTQTGFGVRKYMSENFTGNLQTGYGGNIPIIRYAEILLSYLEAELEAGQPITPALLDATINKVRGRASVNMPPITQTNSALLRPILRNERRVELALEGLRYWDLLRWKIADQVLKGDFYGEAFNSIKTAIRKKGTTVDPYFRWYVTTKNFRKGTDEHWPIPQSEMDINPKLAQ
jgi:hypothetical protein